MPRMTGDRYFAEALHAYGVTHVFFVPTMLLPAMAEAENFDIRHVVTHGEKAAAYMADGYARALHRPGICMAQNIGSTNLAAGLRDAYMACSPVIALTGGSDPASRYRHMYQEVEDHGAWDGVTKADFRVDAIESFPRLLRQSFRVATSGAPGPVHLDIRGSHGQVLEQEADLAPLFEERFREYPAFRPAPEPAAVQAALAALAVAERPIIVAGGGVTASGAGSDLVKLAEALSIPVATGLNAKDAIPDDHSLNVGVCGTYSRACANRAVAEADLVFFVGSHTGSQITTNWRVPPPERDVIQLDIDAEELGRSYPNKVALLGDAKITLQALYAAVKTTPDRAAWVQHTQELVREYWAGAEDLRSSDAVETAVRFGINAVMVVNNNFALNQEKQLMDAAYGGEQRGHADEMWLFRREANLAKVAEDLGRLGIRVEKPADIRPALEKALAAHRPAVVEVISDVNAMAARAWAP